MQTRNLILAISLSVLVYIAWFFIYENPRIQKLELEKKLALEQQQKVIEENKNKQEIVYSDNEFIDRSKAIEETKSNRININNGTIEGSINLIGARFDDISLINYKISLDKNASDVDLFSPANTLNSYFSEFGFIAPSGAEIELPNKDSIWIADKTELKADDTITLSWINSANIKFIQEISLDKDYLFTVKRKIENNGTSDITVIPYGLISRNHIVNKKNYNMVLHEGVIGEIGGELKEYSFKELKKDGKIDFTNSLTSWVGISDKYWLSSLIMKNEDNSPLDVQFRAMNKTDYSVFQTDFIASEVGIKSNSFYERTDHLFVGAKEIKVLDQYNKKLGLELFDRTVDFGILYFLTKPLFLVLQFLYHFIGNFGVAIICLTIIVKLLLFPLASKGYKSMNKMKELHPEILELRKKHQDNKMLLNQEIMALYKKKSVNPAAGCLPIILQIPVFFALYKVLLITIEMRHAPFYGWIKDLSAPDPTSIFNLFGLLPWETVGIFTLGVLPIAMGITMILQQRMNPEPADPLQAKLMKMLPFIFIFVFASFPAGLVLYWTFSNILSILQQYLINKIHR